LLDATKDVPTPFLLDFATGTGRLSYALTSRPEFKGHIIALDLSQGMLEQALNKLSPTSTSHSAPLSAGEANVEFLRHLALPLPFPDSTFDVVCALEVLELFPNMQEPLAEFTRVLRPGGVLLTSRGTEASGRKAKVKSRYEYGLLLLDNGFENFEISPWWKLFDRVIAVKNGSSEPVQDHRLQDVLRCSNCGKIQWKKRTNSLHCGHCGRELRITEEGILLN